jgi:transcriptional regulator with XRE-family HTH domain
MSFTPSPEFGRYIRELRESKQWSREFLEEFGISKSTVERWENGEISRPRRSTFELFAKAFDLNVDDLITRYKNSMASDTAQATNCQPGNDETSTLIPRDTTEAPASSFNDSEPKKVVYYLAFIGVACVMLAALASFALLNSFWIQSSEIKPIVISGKVSCIDNEPVEGIWVDAVDGDHGWAIWYKINSNGSEAAFNYALRYGDAYNLNVGCGGSPLHWKYTDKTENGSGTIQDHNSHFLTCKDPPSGVVYGSCWLKY